MGIPMVYMCNYFTVTGIFSSLLCKYSPRVSVLFTVSAKSTEGKVICSNTLGLFHCMHTHPNHTLHIALFSLQTFSGCTFAHGEELEASASMHSLPGLHIHMYCSQAFEEAKAAGNGSVYPLVVLVYMIHKYT